MGATPASAILVWPPLRAAATPKIGNAPRLRPAPVTPQSQPRVACSRLPPIEPMFRSCGLAASRHASRSTSGICGSHSSSASVAPAPLVFPSMPAGTPPRMSTSGSLESSPPRISGTTSVPPWIGSAPSISTLDARRSSTPLPRFGLAERAQHLLARDRERANLRTGGVADRIRDRGGGRDDRRGGEPLGAEVRQVRIGLVDQLADDLRDVRDRRQLVRVESRREDAARLRVDEALLRQGVPDALDDPALDLAGCPERVDHAADV